MKQLLIICLLLFSVQLFASIDSLTIKTDRSIIVQKKFEKNALDNYKHNEDFNYIEDKINAEPSWFEKSLKWLGKQFLKLLEWIFGVQSATGIFSFIVQVLPYLILLAVLLLLVKIFMRVNSNSLLMKSKNKSVVHITEDEELIKSEDLPKLIQQAINNKNFRLAVRYYYLLVLKQLEEKELIVWEQQKTNEDYIKEISTKNIQKSFKNITRLYDFVWYGNFEINELEFAQVEADFQNTAKQITN